MSLLFATSLLLASPSARAAGEEAQSNAAALRAFVQKGNSFYALGHFKQALEQFEAAYQIKPLAGLLYNIAQCHRQLKEFEEAATTYRSFIRLDPNNPNVGNAKDLLVEVESALQQQRKAATAAPLDESRSDNLAPPRTTPGPAPKIVTTAPVVSGPGVGGPAPIESVQAQPTRWRRPSVYTWVAEGAGVVALGAGAAFGVASKSAGNDLTSSAHSRADIASLESEQKSRATAADALFAVGATLIVLGGVIYVLHH